MVFKSIIGAISASLLYLSVTLTVVSVIYDYTGNNFDGFSDPNELYDSSMSVTVTVELANALDVNLADQGVLPLSYTISNGLDTLTSQNSDGDFSFWTDSAGNITRWFVGARTSNVLVTVGQTNTAAYTWYEPGNIESTDNGWTVTCLVEGVTHCIETSYEEGFIIDNPGTWTVRAVPAPAALCLFISGLIGLIGLARRKTE